MGIVDAFQAEDRVEVKFSTFYEMMKKCAEGQLIANAVKANVPHRYIREMMTGVSEKKVTETKE